MLDALAPHGEARLDLGRVGDAVLRREPGPLVVLGGAVLRQLGERHVRPRRHQRRRGSSCWNAWSRARSGPSAITPRSALWPSTGERQHLVVVVGSNDVDRVEHALRAARLGLGPLAVDPVEEVQHTPPDATARRGSTGDEATAGSSSTSPALDGLDGGEVERVVAGHHVAHLRVGLPALALDEQAEHAAHEGALDVGTLDARRLGLARSRA